MSNRISRPAYGPGDPQTWPPCTGHPNDPRTPEPPEWDQMTDEQKIAELMGEFTAKQLARQQVEAIDTIAGLHAALLHLEQAYRNPHSPQHRAAALDAARGELRKGAP